MADRSSLHGGTLDEFAISHNPPTNSAQARKFSLGATFLRRRIHPSSMGPLMIVPPLLRNISCEHRDAVTHALGPVRPEPGWAPPDLDVLFLCFTNRCGSNYLAQLLATTDAFNVAGEFFNAPTVLKHAMERDLRSLPAYFSALSMLVPHTGRIAAKVVIGQLSMLADAGILDALRGRATYLLLERQDQLGQAISRVIAWQNGRWSSAHASDIPDSALLFDRAAIDTQLAWVANENAAFSRFFFANGIVPMHVTYEDLLADPAPTIEAVAAAMRLTGLYARPEKVAIRTQANAINGAWRSAYLTQS
jgi:LPS sulfotransferase NodH